MSREIATFKCVFSPLIVCIGRFVKEAFLFGILRTTLFFNDLPSEFRTRRAFRLYYGDEC